MTRPGSRWKVVAGIVVVALVAVGLWWRSGSSSKRAVREDAAGDRADGPAARVNRGAGRGSVHDDFGAQFRATGRVTLHGQVIDVQTREGVADIEVLFAAPAGEATVEASADGTFSIDLAPGPYDVRAIGDRVYAPARRVMVGSVSDAVLEVEVSPLAQLHGRVIDGEGAPVAGATVSTHVPRELRKAFEADAMTTQVESDAEGRFTIAAFPGVVHLSARATVGEGRVELTDVQPGDASEEVELQIRPFGAVSGIVTDPRGAPVEGVTVTISIRAPGTPIRQQQSQVTARDGKFAFTDLIAGAAILDGRAAGYAAAPVKVRINAGEHTDGLVLPVSEGLALEGRVIDRDGVALASMRVNLVQLGSGITYKSVKAGLDGRFQFNELAEGAYTITVERDGFTTYRELASLPDAPIEVVVDAPGRIQGVVTSPQGLLTEFTVAVTSFVPTGAAIGQPAGPPARFVTDDGRYELNPLQPGQYDLAISAPGHAPTTVSLAVTADAVVDGSVRLVPSP